MTHVQTWDVVYTIGSMTLVGDSVPELNNLFISCDNAFIVNLLSEACLVIKCGGGFCLFFCFFPPPVIEVKDICCH